MKIKILLVEDDVNLGLLISDHLEANRYEVTVVDDGAQGLIAYNSDVFHLCVLDVMLPKIDGFSLAKDIRKLNSDIPILFLTAKSMTEDKIRGFEVGGDDYLTKPFSVEELQLRVRALLKRVKIDSSEEQPKEVNIGNYIYHFEDQSLVLNDSIKILTKKEAKILNLLYKYKNQVITREIILKGVWGQDDYFVGRSLDVFITKLRKYFKDDSRIVISNLHGVGFKFELPE